jgi:hypothetical protein
MIEVVRQTESALPNKHLIAQQMEGPIGGDCDFTAHPDVPVIVAQYAWESSWEQMGGLKALDYEYGKNKPIDFNETDYYPGWYAGDRVAASRVEAWEFMTGGGASFNQLNGLYTVRDPAGDTPDNARLLGALQSLKQFLQSFDFLQMRPGTGFVVRGVPLGVFARGMSEPGRQYALYHHHSTLKSGGNSYRVVPGKYQEDFTIDLPEGRYRAEWVEPASGSVVRTDEFAHAGGSRSVSAPQHEIDIALRVKRM